MKLILASQSPRRKEILQKAGYDFKIIPSNHDEKISGLDYSEELVQNCAYQKALDVYKDNKNDLIISCDTVVVINNKILGKPKDYKEAFIMLSNLSNKTHFVESAICLIYKNKILKKSDRTFVTFRDLFKEDIEKYILNKSPYDKAGSYAIQDEGFDFAIKIQGNLDNVIGFPLELFEKMYNKILIL